MRICFFLNIFFIWKSSLSRSKKSKSDVSKIKPPFKKKFLNVQKFDRKSLNFFPSFWPIDSSYCSKTSFKWLPQSFYSVRRYFFLEILQPRHFIWKISFYLSKSFPRFKKRGLTETRCTLPQIVQCHVMLLAMVFVWFYDTPTRF